MQLTVDPGPLVLGSAVSPGPWPRSSLSVRSCWPDARCGARAPSGPARAERAAPREPVAGASLGQLTPDLAGGEDAVADRGARRKARPSLRLARTNTAIKIASADSNGGWSPTPLGSSRHRPRLTLLLRAGT